MRFISFLSVLLGSMAVLAQYPNHLDINGIKARINADGFLFHDSTIQSTDPFDPPFPGSFEVPKGSGIHAFYSGSLWLAAKHAAEDTIRASCAVYQEEPVFSAGPLADDPFSEAYKQRYRQVWKVDRSQIEEHRLYWSSVGYSTPPEIAGWPGNGNSSNGEALRLAPFMDFNENDLYEPELGEYPCIRGDQAIYAIFNDVDVRHQGAGEALGVEVHLMAYEVTGTGIDALEHTVFLNYKIINRSEETYEDLYIGSFMDGDLGCSDDDYVGCDSVLNAFFFYNGDGVDEDCRQTKGYGTNIPASGVKFLGEKMSSFLYYDRGSGIIGDPQTPRDFYYYLTSRWRDSTPVTIGGTGYGGSIPINYMYPGDPTDTNQWSDIVTHPFDRRGVGATGPYTMGPGDVIDLDLAVVWARPATNDLYASVAVLKNAMQEVQQYYDEQVFCDFFTGREELAVGSSAAVYPNPAKDQLNFSFGSTKPVSFYLTDILGKRQTADLSPVRVLNIAQYAPGVYFLVFNWESERTVERIVIR